MSFKLAQLMKSFLYYETLSLIRNPLLILQWLVFFLLLLLLFVFALGNQLSMLTVLSGPFIWMGLLLSVFLSIHQLFTEEMNKPLLEQYCLSTLSLPFIVGSKMVLQALAIFIPFLIISPLFFIFFDLSFATYLVLLVSVFLGLPALLLLAGVGAVLISELNNAALLLAILIFPWFIPILIFALNAFEQSLQHLPVTMPLLMLAGICIFCLTLMPFVMAGIFKMTR